VLADPLFKNKRITVAAEVPVAVDPFVAVYRTVTLSTLAPFYPAVNARASAVPAVSVPSIALVLVMAVDRIQFITPELGVSGKIGAVLAGMARSLRS
jgi:hypothetical protein